MAKNLGDRLREKIRPLEEARAKAQAELEAARVLFQKEQVQQLSEDVPKLAREYLQRAVARGSRMTSVEISAADEKVAREVYARVAPGLQADGMHVDFEVDPDERDMGDARYTAYRLKIGI